MSSYLSNLLTHTTSKYNSLRRVLLSNEDDGDTEDDSHITRVLRAYYTEKGRPFPPWLPPDPNDRRNQTPQPHGSPNPAAGSGYFTSAGGRSQYPGVAQSGNNPAGSRGSLSDLWDTPSAQPTVPAAPQSLRPGRRPMAAVGSTLAPPAAAPQARPLPSQRAGSYQSLQAQQQQQYARPGLDPSPPQSSSGGSTTAQDRLKARLWGGNRGGMTPPGSSGSGSVGGGGTRNPYESQPPLTSANAPWSSGGGGNPYDSGGGGGGAGGNVRRYGRSG